MGFPITSSLLFVLLYSVMFCFFLDGSVPLCSVRFLSLLLRSFFVLLYYGMCINIVFYYIVIVYVLLGSFLFYYVKFYSDIFCSVLFRSVLLFSVYYVLVCMFSFHTLHSRRYGIKRVYNMWCNSNFWVSEGKLNPRMQTAFPSPFRSSAC